MQQQKQQHNLVFKLSSYDVSEQKNEFSYHIEHNHTGRQLIDFKL